MDEEVRLYTNNADRERYNLLATLFGITVALDYLERAFVRDSITAAEYVLDPFLILEDSAVFFCFLSKRYSPACTRLIAQYKTMLKLVGDSVPSIEEFMAKYRVRLIAVR